MWQGAYLWISKGARRHVHVVTYSTRYSCYFAYFLAQDAHRYYANTHTILRFRSPLDLMVASTFSNHELKLRRDFLRLGATRKNRHTSSFFMVQKKMIVSVLLFETHPWIHVPLVLLFNHQLVVLLVWSFEAILLLIQVPMYTKFGWACLTLVFS